MIQLKKNTSTLSLKQIRRILLGLSAITMIWMSLSSSISGDEDIHKKYGERVLSYFQTQGADTSYRKEIRGPDYAYNYTFDVIAEISHRALGINDIHTWRHILNALVGWLIILVASIMAKKHFGLLASIWTIVFFLVSPKFMGHAMNNPKDIPFALGYILGLHAIINCCLSSSSVSWRQILVLGLSIGLCLNFRIGGLILICYLFLFAFLILLAGQFKKSEHPKLNLKQAFMLFTKLALASVLAYIIMVVTWPYALENPIKNPFNSLKIMSNFTMNIRQLFEGKNVMSNSLPSKYVYTWMYMSIPVLVLLAFVCGLITRSTQKLKHEKWVKFFLLFSIAFPLAYTSYKQSNLYGGWRHFTFVYPCIIILAASGWQNIWSKIKNNKFARYSYLGITALLLYFPTKHIIKYHPVEYVYFNELAGGVAKNYGKFEMDYYMHSLKPATEWLKEYIEKHENDTVRLVSNHSYSVRYYTRNLPKIKADYARYYSRLNQKWDYGIFVNCYIDRSELRNSSFPPTGTIHTIDVEGKPMCAIVKRPSHASEGYMDDLKSGVHAYRGKNKLRKYFQADPNNFECNFQLGWIYQQIKMSDSATYFLNQAKRVNRQRYYQYTQSK